MANRRRQTAWLLAGLVLFATLVGGFEIACEAHHVCAGADCRICAHITAVRVLLRTAAAAVACTASAAVCLRLRRSTVPSAARSVFGCSPVFLKVRLLN